jgi:hypothetical protein
MDVVKSVLDVLGGCIASHCTHIGVVVLLAKRLHPAKGESGALKQVNFTIRAPLVRWLDMDGDEYSRDADT